VTEWTAIRIAQARQVAELMDVDEAELPDAELNAASHYAALRAADDRRGAIEFIAHALPRFEAIAWAARILDEESRTYPLDRRDRQALDRALRWLGDVDDRNRRATYDAALTARDSAPERLLALAVHFSGGSISEPDLPPVLPPPEMAGRFAGHAVLAAACRSPEPEAVMDRALALADRIAEQGLKALQPG
jgi:hypothetical protein